jgi:hypothetical protein
MPGVLKAAPALGLRPWGGPGRRAGPHALSPPLISRLSRPATVVLRGAVFLGASLSCSRPPCLDDLGKYGVEGCCYRTFWAVVETDDTFVRGRSVAWVAHLARGQYEVVFTSDVSQGVYVASIGRPGIATEPAGEIGVALRCCLTGHETNKGVWVDTHDSNGRSADRAFHLIVHTQ